MTSTCEYCGKKIASHPTPGHVYGGIDFKLNKWVCGECHGKHPQWKKDITEWRQQYETRLL